MGVENWSTTASDNDDADLANGIDWREGQTPGSINNSARAMMAAIKTSYGTLLKVERIAAAGVSVVDLTAPTGAKTLRVTGNIYVTATSNITSRVSFDGATFASASGDYRESYTLKSTGTGTVVDANAASTTSLRLTIAGDSTTTPQFFVANFWLTRPSTSAVFRTHSLGTSQDVTAGHRFAHVSGYSVRSGSELSIAKVRILGSTSDNWASGSELLVEWFA
jgi:hypothetical protein